MKPHGALVQLFAFILTVFVVSDLSCAKLESSSNETNALTPIDLKSSTTVNSTNNSTTSADEGAPTKDTSGIYLILAAGGILLLCVAVWLAWRYFSNRNSPAKLDNNARRKKNKAQLQDSTSQSSSETSPEGKHEIPNKDTKKDGDNKKRKKNKSEHHQATGMRKTGAKRVKSPAQSQPSTKIDNLTTSGQSTSSGGATSGATTSSTSGSTNPTTTTNSLGNSKRSKAIGDKKGSTAPSTSKPTTATMLQSVVSKMNKVKSMVTNAFSAKKKQKDEEGKDTKMKEKSKVKMDKAKMDNDMDKDKLKSTIKKAEKSIKKMASSKSRKGSSKPSVISEQPQHVTASKTAPELKEPAQQPTPAPLLPTAQSTLSQDASSDSHYLSVILASTNNGPSKPTQPSNATQPSVASSRTDGSSTSSQMSIVYDISSSSNGLPKTSQPSGVNPNAITNNNKSDSLPPKKSSPVVMVMATPEDVGKTQPTSILKSQATDLSIYESCMSGPNSNVKAKFTDANVTPLKSDKHLSNGHKSGQDGGKQIELAKVEPIVPPSASPVVIVKDAKKDVQPQPQQPANKDKDNSKK